MTLHNLWFNAVPRCLLCCDLTSELADISCGDPWIPEVTANETIGRSLIISRSKSSEHICQNACNTNYVDFKDISQNKVKQSSDMMRTKKEILTHVFFLGECLRERFRFIVQGFLTEYC
jgi:coenzyme F420 hydrogenase subunit beta